jgi:hypothetical protein
MVQKPHGDARPIALKFNGERASSDKGQKQIFVDLRIGES